jgi:CheY-like chemotaxis protein
METVRSVFKSIWLADDDHDDQLVFESVIKEIFPAVNLSLFTDSDKLLNELKRSTPDLLFLDIHMPCLDGKQCLKVIKQNAAYRQLPVIMLTGSNYEEDIKASYEAGAALYLVKPDTYEIFAASLKKILQMNWDNPQSITNNQYVNKRFVPF